MSLFRKPWCAVVFWLSLMLAIGLAGMIYGLTLYGITHAASVPECTSEVSSNALAFIGLKSLDTQRAELCLPMIGTRPTGLVNGETMGVTVTVFTREEE